MAKRKKKKFSKDNEGTGKAFSSNGDTSAKSGDQSESSKVQARVGTNDPAWYATDLDLLRDAASYPFAYPIGDTQNVIDVGYSSDDFKVDREAFSYSVPGVIALELSPSIGVSRRLTDPVNVAANAVYARVRYQNSGRKNYDPCDLMLYLMAAGQYYSMIVWMQRLYGYAFMYSQRNKYVPRGWAEAEEVDLDDIVRNLANFRYAINAYINKVSSWAVPATLTYFSRMAFLYRNVYTEGNSIKDQTYLLTPHSFWQFKLDADSKGSLHALSRSNYKVDGKLKYSTIIQWANDLMSNTFQDEDFGIMSGDILKAYGDNIIKLASLPEEYPIIPIYDPLVLTQFKNAKLMFSVASDSDSIPAYDVTQDEKGVLLSHLKTNVLAPDTIGRTIILMRWRADKIMSINNDFPTPAEVIESSRFMPAESDVAVGTYDHYISCGSEFVTNARVVWWTQEVNSDHAILKNVHVYAIDGMNISLVYIADDGITLTDQMNLLNANDTVLRTVEALSAFKWAPQYDVFALTTKNSESDPNDLYLTKWRRIWGVDNITILTNANISKMQEAALMGLFHVPGVAKVGTSIS